VSGTGGDERPIALFDSGFGGLTVARAVIDLLPDEHVVYVGDTGRYPYGSRDQDEVAGFAHQITRFLVDQHDAKLVIVACNTAAAAALGSLQEATPVPVVGVIEPGTRSLVRATRSGRVGVIGTVGTIGSGAYQRAVAATGADVHLTCAACPGFVEFVERDDTRSDQVHVLAERLLAPVVDADVDALLLGCTHYPFLARTISDVMGRDVVLVSSADETAFEVRAWLEAPDGPTARSAAAGPARHTFLSSGDVDWFRQLGSRLLGPEVTSVQPAPWN
jgi:glutamate racemase